MVPFHCLTDNIMNLQKKIKNGRIFCRSGDSFVNGIYYTSYIGQNTDNIFSQLIQLDRCVIGQSNFLYRPR